MKKFSEKMKDFTNKVFNKTEDLIETGLENGSVNAVATCASAYGLYRNYKKYVSCNEDTTYAKLCKLGYAVAAIYAMIMVAANATYAVYNFCENVLHITSSNEDEDVVE